MSDQVILLGTSADTKRIYALWKTVLECDIDYLLHPRKQTWYRAATRSQW